VQLLSTKGGAGFKRARANLFYSSKWFGMVMGLAGALLPLVTPLRWSCPLSLSLAVFEPQKGFKRCFRLDHLINGSGFLAVTYLAVIIGNSSPALQQGISSTASTDGIAWLSPR